MLSKFHTLEKIGIESNTFKKKNIPVPDDHIRNKNDINSKLQLYLALNSNLLTNILNYGIENSSQ
jgi:hypothetical protein